MKKMIKTVFFLVGILTAFLTAPVPTWSEEGVALSKDGVPIAYSVYGQGEPTLVFIHGWNCNQSFWRKQVPYFAKKYRVVTLDLAGHGASGRERTVYSMAAFGEDVAAVVRAVGAPRVILLGHSMGGPVIMAAGEIFPDRVMAIVGIDTLQNFDEVYTTEQVKDIVRPFEEDFAKAVDPFVRSMFVKGTDPRFIDDIVGTMASADPKIAISAMKEMFSTSYVEHPPKVTAPVWVLNADLWPTNPEANRKYVPEFNLRLMPGLGHFLMLEAPDEFNKRLDEIITEIVKTK